MLCPGCHRDNPDDASFCGECGGGLSAEIACPACGRTNRAQQKYCNGCGASLPQADRSGGPAPDPRDYTPPHLADKILRAKSAIEGERKRVTVFFADVRSSVELSEGLDPEDWHRMMERFLEILAAGVHRYEGTVNQYTGDGIMALFGAPIAHEDHAQRACYAALHIREELQRYAQELRRERGLDFAVRFGLNSGEVVVGKIGDDLRMDYTAQGHCVGLAARMEQAAPADRIYLSDATAELVNGYFELEDQGEFRLKGVSEPVRVYELKGPGALRTRLDVSRARGLSRFVGRAEEMEALETALAHGREGQPRVVGVVAEAGVGKSRLCFEFLERCRARGVPTYEAHGVAHGKATPLVPMLQLFRGFYGISDRDSDQQAREKIAGRLVLLDEALREEIPLMCDFLGVPDPERPALRMDPEARQRRLLDALKRIVQIVGLQQPGVTLLEDLHWFDGASDAFLAAFVDAVPGTKGLLLVNFRPEYRAEWMQKSYYQQISLLPFGPEAIRELLDHLLGDDTSLSGLAEHIHARTAGNPFFIEEVVHSLAESGALAGERGAYRLVRPVAEVAVPDTVHALLASRIDRLAEREKQVLQSAAVIGKTFSETLLSSVAQLPEHELRDALAKLERGEFVQEEALHPEIEYAFRHPLTQDVAYNTQLAERRKRIHADVARALAERYAGRIDEQAALLAHHCEHAGEPLEAARWHRRAAEWVGVSDVPEAVRHWESVRRIGREQPDLPGAAELATHACVQLMNLDWRIGRPPDEQTALEEEAQRWVERSGRLRDRALLHYALCVQRMTAGDLRACVRHGREAVRLSALSGDRKLAAVVPGVLSVPLWTTGELAEARAINGRMLEATRDDLDAGVDLWGASSHLLGIFMDAYYEFYCGDLDRGRQGLERCVELARARGDGENEIWALMGWELLAMIGGDVEAALPYVRRAAQRAEQVGGPFSTVIVELSLAQVLLLHGETRKAAELAEHARQVAHERGVCLYEAPYGLALIAESHLAEGRLPAAEAAARESLAESRHAGAVRNEAFALLTLARVQLARPDGAAREEARATLAEAERLFAQMGARNPRALVHLERAQLAGFEGDRERRAAELNAALDLFRTMHAPLRVQEVEAELARAL